jgi:biotin carboxylase
MMSHDPVVIVGTTPDYVAKIHEKFQDATVFVLDPRFRGDPLLKNIGKADLFFTSLEDFQKASQAVHTYLSANSLSPKGIACFDCESLTAASHLASQLGLPSPSLQAVLRSRNKFESRRVWRECGVPSPRAALVSDVQGSKEFFRSVKKDIVMKPVSGSGSELVFHCRDEGDIDRSVRIMEKELNRRRSNPLFRAIPAGSGMVPFDPCESWVTEEFVDGPEFSCDFLLHNNGVTVLRETGKVRAPDQPFGTILAYMFPPKYPERFTLENLSHILERATKALGFIWGHFMVDFIIQDGCPVIIEMTPRPGGDSIPDLIETATGYDLLGMHLDIVSGKFSLAEILPKPTESFLSVNLYATKEGVITHLDPSRLLPLPWVKALVLKKNVGDEVKLPPHDYDNRLLGYCIISSNPCQDPINVSQILAKLLNVSIEN